MAKDEARGWRRAWTDTIDYPPAPNNKPVDPTARRHKVRVEDGFAWIA